MSRNSGARTDDDGEKTAADLGKRLYLSRRARDATFDCQERWLARWKATRLEDESIVEQCSFATEWQGTSTIATCSVWSRKSTAQPRSFSDDDAVCVLGTGRMESTNDMDRIARELREYWGEKYGRNVVRSVRFGHTPGTYSRRHEYAPGVACHDFLEVELASKPTEQGGATQVSDKEQSNAE